MFLFLGNNSNNSSKCKIYVKHRLCMNNTYLDVIYIKHCVQKIDGRYVEMVQQLRTFYALPEKLDSIFSTHMQNCSFRISDALFWCLRTPCVNGVYRHTHRQNSHRHFLMKRHLDHDCLRLLRIQISFIMEKPR